MRKSILFIFLIFFLSGCSSVKTYKAPVSLATIKSSERFQLKVHTGNPTMDNLIYEMALQQFGSVLPLKESEPYTGFMEITFVSSDQSSFIGSSTSWYTGSSQIGRGTASVAGMGTNISSGSVLTWQNSTMIIVLKKTDGTRLWTADYNYKGGMEMSGFVVNTPHEASRLVLERLKENFDDDFLNQNEPISHYEKTPLTNQAVKQPPVPSYQNMPVAQPQVIQQPVTQTIVEEAMPSYEQTYQQPQAHTSGKDLRECLALVDNALIAKCVRASK